MGFSGEPHTIWLDARSAPADAADRNMSVISDFSFTDRHGKIWLTPAGYVVDGASIPRALWTLVGSPYTGHYRRASIVHDKACDDADDAAARCGADRMFFEACMAGGCSWVEAAYLYVGVRIGAILSASAPELLEPGEGPMIVRPQDDEVISRYQHMAQEVTQPGPTDDPVEIERRADAAAAKWSRFKDAARLI